MRPRRPHPRPAALLAVLALASAAGCGGADWRTQADAVCADVARKAAAQPPDLARAATLVREQADRLDDVAGPPELDRLARGTRAAGDALERSGRDPAALAALARRDDRLTRQARHLDLPACARGTP